MGKPTRLECLNLARDLVGDTSVAGGDYFTDAVLGQGFNTAFRNLVRALELFTVPEFERVVYFHVGQYVARVNLADKGHEFLGDPTRIREAPASALWNISAVTNTVPVVATLGTAPTGVGPGSWVYVFDVGGQTAANGKWVVSAVAGNDITLAGALTSNAYTSGGQVATISGKLIDMYPVSHLSQEALATSNREYIWRNGSIEFNPTSGANGRLMEVTYFERVEPPTANNGIVPVNDSVDVIAHMTAAAAARSSNAFGYAAELDAKGVEHMAKLLQNYRLRRRREE